MAVPTWLKSKKFIAIAIGVVAAGSIGAYALSNREPDVSYRTGVVEKGSLTSSVAASGTLNAVVQVSVSSQVSGQIKEVLVDFNSEVKKDQLIARIDPESFEYRLRQTQADLDATRAQVLVALAQVSAQRANVSRAQTNLAEAQRDFDRKTELVAKNFLSPAEKDKATSALANANEDLKSAKAQLEVSIAQQKNAESLVRQREAAVSQSRVDLERTRITAPVDGIVIKRSIEPGQTVAASLSAPELFVIAQNLRDMQVETSIDESEVGRVRVGQRASFTVDAFAGRTFNGQVMQVRKAAQNSSNVITYTAVVSAANPDAILLPGMTANVRIVIDSKPEVLKVPNAALRYRPPGESDQNRNQSGQTAQGGSGGAPGAGAGGGPGGGGGGMRGMSERLTKELNLNDQQKQKLEAVSASMREKFMAVREAPEAERSKLAQAARSEMRAKIEEFLTPEQRVKYAALQAEQAGRGGGFGGGRGRVFILDEKGKPKAVDVRTGITDGTSTEIIIPAAATAASGVTAEAASGATAASGVAPAAVARLNEGDKVVISQTGGATASRPAATPQQAGPRMF